jgi:ABC-type branched-subunit amino acid transport system substrate-binding protein
MRSRIFTLFVVILAASLARAAEPPTDSQPKSDAPAPSVEIDAGTQKVLDEINSLNPYQRPNLPLKLEDRYAHTADEAVPHGQVQPDKKHFLLQMEYAGPGRAIPEPEDVKTVKIGFLGPIYPTVSVATGGKSHEETLGKRMLQGAELAIEHANAGGGYLKRKIPFELVVKNDNGLWGSSGEEIINLSYVDNVWAILGSIDGANTHIAIRVGLKIEIPMMSSGDTDPTFIETNIPWVMRCIGDDRQQSYLLADYLYRKLDFRNVGIVRASNRYGRFGIREIRDTSRRVQRPIATEMAYRVGDEDFSLQLSRLEEAKVDAVVHWGNAEDGARFLNQMRARGMKQPFFACDRCASDDFVKIAGPNAEGVICAYPWNPDRQDPKLVAFREAYRHKYNEDPETYAAHAYDGVSMLIWGIQVAGLNRAKIRDVLAYRTQPWPGVTGDIPLSSCMDDAGEVFLTKYEGGKWKYFSREDLGLPKLAPTVQVQQTKAE